jgi:hypothetical protein
MAHLAALTRYSRRRQLLAYFRRLSPASRARLLACARQILNRPTHCRANGSSRTCLRRLSGFPCCCCGRL